MRKVCLPQEDAPKELSSSRKNTGIRDPALQKQGRWFHLKHSDYPPSLWLCCRKLLGQHMPFTVLS